MDWMHPVLNSIVCTRSSSSPTPSTNKKTTNRITSRLPATTTDQSSSLALRTNLFFSTAAKSRPLDDTLKLLPLLPTRNTVTWNTAISACIRHRRPVAALHLLLDMLLSPSSPPPDAITLRAALRAASAANHRPLLPQLHAYILKLLPLFSSPDQTILTTCLLNLSLEFDHFTLAHQLFDRMPERDVITFASILTGCTDYGQHGEALRIFHDMMHSDKVPMNEHVYSCALRACAALPSVSMGRQIHARVVKLTMDSNVFIGTGLVDMYAKSGEMGCCRRALAEISEPNVVSWNALLSGELDGEEGLRLFDWMRSSGVSPDRVTFASVLRSCKDVCGIRAVQQMHCLIVKTMIMIAGLDVFVGGILFELYLDRGFYSEARRIFSETENKDSVAFNLAIQGYLRNGHGAEALWLFMEVVDIGIEVSEVTMKSLLMWVGLEQGKQLHALLTKFGYFVGDGSTAISSPLARMYSNHGKQFLKQIHHAKRIHVAGLN